MHYELLSPFEPPEPILQLCPKCGEYTIICESERVCINIRFGSPLPEDECKYEWTHTSTCNVIANLKQEIKTLKGDKNHEK